MKRTLVLAVAASFMFAACTTPGSKTAIGAGTGAVVGAGTGAIIAASTGGKAGQGAVWGAAAGVLAGGLVGQYFQKQANDLAKIANVTKTDDGLVITLKNDILFATGSADLSAAALQNIADISKVLKKYPCNIIVVEGHTDSTGTVSGNQTLSERRAAAVKNALTANQVKTYSLRSVGYGQTSPIASNSTAEGRTQNRRVNLHITANQEVIKKQCNN
ncbi:Outer membrane protein OmpA [Parelusimicrobium proximum]|uniref:OmpA family protein n=1 Tax=Parelusimicrobium proximum TaxID=3228953 RepID=UPI003D16A404